MVVRHAENVKVVVRVRPMTKRELDQGDEELVRCVSDRSVQVVDSAQQRGVRAKTALAYQFERCFGQSTTQEELFDACGVKEQLDHVLEGFSATVFAYGPTGSGKTFSVTGRPDSIVKHGSGDGTDGIVIRAAECLFDKIRAEQRDGLQFKVRASCVEIYNENIVDLIKSSRNARGAEVLPVKFDPSKGAFFVHDLSYGKCPSEVDLLRLYMKALRNRSVAAHQMNMDSSRSHALFTVYVDSVVCQPHIPPLFQLCAFR